MLYRREVERPTDIKEWPKALDGGMLRRTWAALVAGVERAAVGRGD